MKTSGSLWILAFVILVICLCLNSIMCPFVVQGLENSNLIICGLSGFVLCLTAEGLGACNNF